MSSISRLVTVLPAVDMIYEKLLSKQINEYMEPKLSHYLSAYRKNNGCESTILRLVENWKKDLDGKNVVGVLSSDMSKAFDSLCPPLVIKKLESYHFSDNALNLVRSYFSQRKNRVRLGSATSQWRDVVRGCPQGSTFGPLLWNVFQNDLTQATVEADISMYADDHQIFSSDHSIGRVEDKLLHDGSKITKWYEDNLLQVSIKKYQSMVLGERNGTVEMNMQIGGVKIEQSHTIKLLGVNIDSDLKFSNHIREVCTKSSHQIGVLSRLRNLIPTPAKLQLFKAAILPHLTYCSTVWHFCRASDRRKLERLQERALRTAFNSRSDSYQNLLMQAKLPTLYNRRLQDIAILMFKAKNNLLPKYLQDLFNLNGEREKRYNLRNSDFTLPRFNKIKYGKTFSEISWAFLVAQVDKGGTLYR